MRQVGATLHRGARASHYRGLSCCGAQAPDAQAQQLWLTGLVAPWHVGSSQTRARTRVPCIGRQILNHCATREAPTSVLDLTYTVHTVLPQTGHVTSACCTLALPQAQGLRCCRRRPGAPGGGQLELTHRCLRGSLGFGAESLQWGSSLGWGRTDGRRPSLRSHLNLRMG